MSTDNNDRKATDILLDLEAKIDKALAYLATIDMNHKLLLNKLNSLSTKEPQDLPVQSPPKPEYVFSDVDDPMEDESIPPELEVDKNPTGKRRAARGQNLDVKMVPVQQKITYPDGSNVCVAKVEIHDSTGKLVKQMRTNQVGKWMISLLPGTYTVSIAKMPSTNKSKVELNYEINVPVSDSIVELESKRVNK